MILALLTGTYLLVKSRMEPLGMVVWLPVIGISETIFYLVIIGALIK